MNSDVHIHIFILLLQITSYAYPRAIDCLDHLVGTTHHTTTVIARIRELESTFQFVTYKNTWSVGV